MLDDWRERIKRFDELLPAIQACVEKEPVDLNEVWHAVFRHVRSYETEALAEETAEELTSDLCDELPDTDATFLALQRYVSGQDHPCFNAYDRLLTDFKDRLTKERYRELFEEG